MVKIKMKNHLITTVFFVIFFASTVIGQDNKEIFKWQIGEELTYKVSWGFIRLGTLQLSILDTVQIDGMKAYHTRLSIDSNPWLFFVNMHSTFNSYLLENSYPLLLICEEEIDNEEYHSRYEFDYENSEIIVHHEGIENPDKTIDKSLPLNKKLQDGMSIIYYARANCYREKSEHLVVFYAAQEGTLEIKFSSQTESIEVSFTDGNMSAYYINGEAHFKAIAGFGGNYEGWFSLDEQRVPLAARMEVFVGSVYLELEEYRNWHPDY